MTALKGSLVLIRVGDGMASETFTTIGGLRLTEFELNQQFVEASDMESGAWRKGIAAGLRSARISGTGVFTGSAAEETMRGYAFGGSVKNFRFIFANGSSITGAFVITSYERSATHEDAEMYAIRLESAGALTYSTS